MLTPLTESLNRLKPEVERLALDRHRSFMLRVWKDGSTQAAESPKKTFVFLNGLESHSLWASPLAVQLSRHGHRFIGFDRRGSGINRHIAGNADDWISDIVRVCEAERKSDPQRSVQIIGQCFGARLAIATVLRRLAPVDGLILLSAGLHMRVDLSLGEKALVGLGHLLRLPIRLPSPIRDDRLMTTDPQWLEYLAADPFRLNRVVAADFFAGHLLLQEIDQATGPLPLPCLAVFAQDDPIVNVPRTIDRLRRLFPSRLTIHELAGADHLLLFGSHGDQAINIILDAAG